jgi:antitoxin component of MazEF toxin-antitoxin module
MRAKVVKLGNTVYVHISPLILEDIKAGPGDWAYIEEQTDGTLKLEIERKKEETQ